MRHCRLLPFTVLLSTILVVPVLQAQLSDEYADWDQGPEGFLLTKKEAKEWETISSDAEAQRFIELFWARRDPNLETPYNEFKAEFLRRVKHADTEYGSEGQRGALSDRAKVLILLGFPHKAEHRAPTETVSLMDNRDTGSDEVRANAKLWFYDPAVLPAKLKIKGSRLLFVFYERKAETNEFVLDRSHKDASLAMRALSRAPDAHFLHPDLDEVPRPVSVVGGEAATAAQLGWLDETGAALQDAVQVVLEPGVADAHFRPLWAHLQVPAGAPEIDVLAGRVTNADGSIHSTFQVPATALDTGEGRAYHLTFPLEESGYTVEIAAASGDQVQLVHSAEVEMSQVPEEGTWLSPLWLGLSAEMDKDAALGTAYCFGGWHLTPLLGDTVSRDNELSYFGYVVRPTLEEGLEPSLTVKVTLKRDGKRLGQPLSMQLPIAKLVDDLYLYANSITLSGLPEAGQYDIEFKIRDKGSDTEIVRALSLNITE